MIHLKTYENFSSQDKEQILSDLNDIFDEVRDDNLNVDISSGKVGYVWKDHISVGIHTQTSGESIVDFSIPSVKLSDISETIKRANSYLSNFSYKMYPMFCIKLSVNKDNNHINRDESEFIKYEDIDKHKNTSYSHISIDWKIPMSFEEIKSNRK